MMEKERLKVLEDAFKYEAFEDVMPGKKVY